MRIGMVGSGRIGGTLAKLLTQAGHEVALSNSRGPDTLREVVERLGERVRAVNVREAAGFGDVVIVAIPFGRYRELPADALAGKIVVDANNYYPQRDSQFEELDTGRLTSSELLQAHVPTARVVKAFNTINYRVLADEGRISAPLQERLVIFVAGDDNEAKDTVTKLIEEIGFASLDTGSLKEGGRRQQPGSAIYTRPLNIAQGKALLDARP